MPVKLCVSLLCFALFLADCNSKPAGDRKSTPANTQPSASASPTGPAGSAGEAKTVADANTGAAAKPALDACSLIEKSEIESVQGQGVSEAKPSSREDDSLVMSQCFYMTADFNRSVSLEVTRRSPKNPDPNAMQKFWTDRFVNAKPKRKAENPRPITGVGDGAYWVGNAKFGTLYALKKDYMVRISVGGQEDINTKMERSKILAGKALERIK